MTFEACSTKSAKSGAAKIFVRSSSVSSTKESLDSPSVAVQFVHTYLGSRSLFLYQGDETVLPAQPLAGVSPSLFPAPAVSAAECLLHLAP